MLVVAIAKEARVCPCKRRLYQCMLVVAIAKEARVPWKALPAKKALLLLLLKPSCRAFKIFDLVALTAIFFWAYPLRAKKNCVFLEGFTSTTRPKKNRKGHAC